MGNNICYHTRAANGENVGQKLTSGSFGGAIDQETVERITRLFDVKIKPSGTPVFVDKEGREVNLYFSIDPRKTEKGKEALRNYRHEQTRIWEEERVQREKEAQELAELLSNFTHEELMRKLSN